MHIMNIEEKGALYDDKEAVDLGQTPGDVIFISAADSDIFILSKSANSLNDKNEFPYQTRIASQLSLNHPFSIDLYIENTCKKANIIIIRLLGGTAYWRYGVEEFANFAKKNHIKLAFLSGDGKIDAELYENSTLSKQDYLTINGYFETGGLDNITTLFGYIQAIIEDTPRDHIAPPRTLLKAGLYEVNSKGQIDLTSIKQYWRDEQPVIAIIFYRALFQAGDLASIDGLIKTLSQFNCNCLPLFVTSLKDEGAATIIAEILKAQDIDVVINLTAFALNDGLGEGGYEAPYPFNMCDAPILQACQLSWREEDWRTQKSGMNKRDLAMNIVLPELDGRIFAHAIGFKGEFMRDELTGAMMTCYQPYQRGIGYVAELALRWASLRHKKASEKKLAMILANYPNRDSRLANGVGLDTPQSVVNMIAMLKDNGYRIENEPKSSDDLISLLKSSVTNQAPTRQNESVISLSAQDYQHYFHTLPKPIRQQIGERWGDITADPFYDKQHRRFCFAIHQIGHIFIAIQPARGYQIDPKSSYHSPDLVPPHNYIAFYHCLRDHLGIDAVIHFGKHGNLEWLPGKALCLSDECYPQIALKPLPHLYPFIVNDPGEGAQAKRRNSAVILDHLTPAFTNAGSYGDMALIEAKMDEYYEAMGLDQIRLDYLKKEILTLLESSGLGEDCQIKPEDDLEEKFLKLDNFLCDVKEAQIKGNLHIYATSPSGQDELDMIYALVRMPRYGTQKGGGSDGVMNGLSILTAIAKDIGLKEFDPLLVERGLPFQETIQPGLAKLINKNIRHNGDVIDILEYLAKLYIKRIIDYRENKPIDRLEKQDFTNYEPYIGDLTWPILKQTIPLIQDKLRQSAFDEGQHFLAGLNGKFIPAGASGAPTRGRLETMPTGRNFYSLDSRALPTMAAWHLGWASAEALIERFVQDHGNWPKAMALSAWGTSNMRTGGDDIAQAMALMGVKPEWDHISRRVTGFEVIPLSLLARPRIDITLRCSGFFRDAFPAQMELIDRIVQHLATLDEPDDMNPIKANIHHDKSDLMTKGSDEDQALRQASLRIFSAKPGAYGAGLQALIDEGIWQERDDFASSFINWSAYGYGEGIEGVDAKGALETRLQKTQAIIHNQDNREHDILDSDDYYQFEGGLSASVNHLSGHDVPIYHNDHSLPTRPIIRTLDEEIGRVIRSRAANPKWIAGVMKHGYKGAFEILATVDYLFAFSATTNLVAEHHFDQIYKAYLEDKIVYDFIEEKNPDALKDIINRFQEAIDRGLWVPKRNHISYRLSEMMRDIKQ